MLGSTNHRRISLHDKLDPASEFLNARHQTLSKFEEMLLAITTRVGEVVKSQTLQLLLLRATTCVHYL